MGPLGTRRPSNPKEWRIMPRTQVKVREHARRKPYQKERTHVDKYVREQEISSRLPAGPEDLGPRDIDEKRTCEMCGGEFHQDEMVRLASGEWYCKSCEKKVPPLKADAGWKQRGMKLLTQADRKRLPKLYSTEQIPVEDKLLQVKFFTPTSNWTWYAVEFDGNDTFFGYVEGFEDEWGYFSLRELSDVKGPMGVGIERDKYWEPIKFGDYIAKKG